MVVGLGNPGSEYAETRHNLGYMVLDNWAAAKGLGFSRSADYDYIVTGKAVLIKPTTFMNLSGRAVRDALTRWDIEDVMVVYDDLELPPASLRIRTGGGDGGHNGLKSIADYYPLEELKRIRIGIGRDTARSAADFVLEQLSESEFTALKPVLAQMSRYLDLYIKYDFSQVLNEYSKWKKSYSDSKKSGIVSPKEENNDKGL